MDCLQQCARTNRMNTAFYEANAHIIIGNIRHRSNSKSKAIIVNFLISAYRLTFSIGNILTTVTNFNSRVRIFREFCKSLEVDIFLTASLLFLHGCYYKTDIVKLAYSMYIFLSPVFLLVKIVFYKTFKASSN